MWLSGFIIGVSLTIVVNTIWQAYKIERDKARRRVERFKR